MQRISTIGRDDSHSIPVARAARATRTPAVKRTPEDSTDDAAPETRRDQRPHAAESLCGHRDAMQRIVQLADHLAPRDRALLRGVLDCSLPASDIASLIDNQPQSIRRRVRNLVEHVASPLYAGILANMNRWGRVREGAARIVLLQRRSQSAAARELGVSMHTVRSELLGIRAVIGDAGSDGRPARRARAESRTPVAAAHD